MSHFLEYTKHPETGKIELATWLDNIYGPHKYGVRFSDDKIFAEDKCIQIPIIRWLEANADEDLGDYCYVLSSKNGSEIGVEINEWTIVIHIASPELNRDVRIEFINGLSVERLESLINIF